MSASATPFFSILIPAYNRPDYLGAAIRSLLENSFVDFEIVISEDCSPGQQQVVAKVQEFLDPRIRCHAQPRNLGWSDNRNFLVAQARGRFVWLMGDDDLLLPRALRQLHAFICRQPGHDVYACGYEVIDELGRHQCARHAARELFLRRENAFAFRQLLLSQALPFWCFHPFTFAYKRELGAQFPYRRAALIGDDLYFLYECFGAGRSIAITPEVLFQWRKFSPAAGRAGQAQVNLSSALNGLKARASLLDLFQASPEWSREIDRQFPKRDFTRRFLHDSLRADSSGQRAFLLHTIRNDPNLAGRFATYSLHWDRWRKWSIRLRMVYAYVRLNGPAGIPQLLARAWREKITPASPAPIVMPHAS